MIAAASRSNSTSVPKTPGTVFVGARTPLRMPNRIAVSASESCVSSKLHVEFTPCAATNWALVIPVW
jgi:hypothetical protein